VIHVSDFISEMIGHIKLSEEDIADQLSCLEEHCLPVFEARKIIYPEKGSDPWWDLPQPIIQVKNMIKVFKYTHPNCVAVFTFD
jgi:hypothetical protein